MADEAFHEIQLNGKQLVFLFMAATVVAVVIFLCGVMVGRGVRAQRGAELAALAATTPVDPTSEVRPAPVAEEPAPTSLSSEAASATAEEPLSYPDRLASEGTALESLKGPAASTSAAPETRRPEPRNEARSSAAARTRSVSVGDGFAVQVAAVRERGEADTIARRLTTRGYPAYVMTPAAGSPRVFRVRVGKFKERREAESTAARLRREEQFKPWITR